MDRQIVTVDVVLLSVRDGRLVVALQPRAAEPFKGRLALVGGYVHAEEDAGAHAAAARVLKAKAGLEGFTMEQLATFSGPARDPRGWSVSIAYLALTPLSRLPPDADVELHPAEEVQGLAFDHDQIVRAARERLRGKGAYSILPAGLLEESFTLGELQEVYRIALQQRRIDKSSFRRKLMELRLVEPAEGRRIDTGGRQAQLYRLSPGVSVFDRRI